MNGKNERLVDVCPLQTCEQMPSTNRNPLVESETCDDVRDLRIIVCEGVEFVRNDDVETASVGGFLQRNQELLLRAQHELLDLFLTRSAGKFAQESELPQLVHNAVALAG